MTRDVEYDPIMEELYRARAEMLAEYGGDWKAMLRDIHVRQEEAKARGVKFVTLKPTRLEPARATREPQDAD